MSDEQKQLLFKQLERNCKLILEEIYEICWNMRGFTREDALSLSFKERKIIHKQIKQRIKLVQETKLPLI